MPSLGYRPLTDRGGLPRGEGQLARPLPPPQVSPTLVFSHAHCASTNVRTWHNPRLRPKSAFYASRPFIRPILKGMCGRFKTECVATVVAASCHANLFNQACLSEPINDGLEIGGILVRQHLAPVIQRIGGVDAKDLPPLLARLVEATRLAISGG
jgi:hypothetical protein